MLGKLKFKSNRDFSKGTWQDIQSSVAPENSVKLGLNLDSDNEMGSLVSRMGTTIINAQLVNNYAVLGLHNYRNTLTGATKLFAAVSDGTNNDIYDAVAGTKSLEDDTKGLKTRFLSYLNSTLRLNGTDQPKAYNGTNWITTAGAFDLDNMPQTSKYAIEFKDRVYVAGRSDYPDRVDISGIASSTSRAVSWTSGNKFVVFEQEDGGGGITGLAKVPSYVLIFKKRTMKRYDGSSAYPEDMINQGAPSQEAIVVAQGLCFWVNEEGAWATEGGKPKKISTYTVDSIIKSCSATNLANVASGTDEEHIFWSFASVTISGETYTNIVLKYNIFQNTWDVRKYPSLHRVYAKYVDASNDVYLVFGDDDGTVFKIDTGNTDNGTSITYSLETQDIDFNMRLPIKVISNMGVLTENVSKGTLMWKNTQEASDWKELGIIDKETKNFKTSLRGNYFNFKITETVSTGQAKLLGFEFPAGIEVSEL